MSILAAITLVLFILMMLLLLLFNLKDKSYRGKRTKDVLSDELKDEIEKEKKEFLRKQALFQNVMDKKKNAK